MSWFGIISASLFAIMCVIVMVLCFNMALSQKINDAFDETGGKK